MYYWFNYISLNGKQTCLWLWREYFYSHTWGAQLPFMQRKTLSPSSHAACCTKALKTISEIDSYSFCSASMQKHSILLLSPYHYRAHNILKFVCPYLPQIVFHESIKSLPTLLHYLKNLFFPVSRCLINNPWMKVWPKHHYLY